MIFYFSGTGNSKLAAHVISDITGDSVISINDVMKGTARVPERVLLLNTHEPLIFIAPVYAWRIPRVISDWIEKTDFGALKKAYFILTCGETIGNATHYAKLLCEKKGFDFCGMANVVMPENYIAMYPVPDKDESAGIIAHAKPALQNLGKKIKNGETFHTVSCTFSGNFQSAALNPFFYTFMVKDKGFYTTDACVSCGLCQTLCPLNNIGLIDGKPLWKGNCTHCMACICGCPAEAIEYKNKSKGRFRYHADKIK